MATCSTISALPFGPPNFTGLEPRDRPDFHGLTSIRATAQAKIEPKWLQIDKPQESNNLLAWGSLGSAFVCSGVARSVLVASPF